MPSLNGRMPDRLDVLVKENHQGIQRLDPTDTSDRNNGRKNVEDRNNSRIDTWNPNLFPTSSWCIEIEMA